LSVSETRQTTARRRDQVFILIFCPDREPAMIRSHRVGFLRSFARPSLLAAAVLLLTALIATAPTPAQQSSLAGQLLVAAPTMGDPRFFQTVILMVRHDRTGAMGIVLNRPLGERPLAALLEALGDKDPGAVGDVPIFAGGPVQLEFGFVIHSAEYRTDGTLDIDGRVAMTSNPQILRDIGNKQGPKQSLIAFGYAGWGPGQLESELARRFWYTAPEDAKLVFETDRSKVWDDAVARRTQEL
jgi:putative transcriptional regulator